jgi:hypothetical protein
MMDGISGSGPLLELRKYNLREGAREYFDRRSREVTFPLFRKYGFRVDRFWASVDEPLTIYYSVRWDSVEEMERTRAAFEADPAWQRMVTADNYQSPVASSESVLLRSVVDFSMIGGGAAGPSHD